MHKKRVTILLGLSLLLGGVPLAARAVVPPSANYDLSHWKLTLPIDGNGGVSGTAVEIKTPELLAGYTSAYFYTDSDGGMAFWSPVIGATTSGSSYPRSELREVLDPQNSAFNWSGNGTHVLSVFCRVTQLPRSGKLIIGQVHGYNTNPVVKLQLNHGDLEAVVKSNLALDADVRFTFPNIGLNTIINYQIKVVDGVVSITVNGITHSHDFFASDPAWERVTFYFKAGSYVQDNVGSLTEGGRVSFYQLATSHDSSSAPTISIQPLSQTVARGGNVTLSVSASDDAPVTYQWRTNSVVWPGRTNASLSLFNFQTVDEKDYDVVVTGTRGAVTSSVARLYLSAPVRFANVGMSNGYLRALLIGAANTYYVIQTSSNSVDWIDVAIDGSSNGIINFVDPGPATRNRYYRAR